MLGGYMGKMLFVNLTDGKIEEKELSEDLARNFLGAYGIGAKILYDMMPAGADPLGPESVLGFVTGPTVGTKTFFSGRYTIVHKSPVTGGWNDASSGGFFGPELKKAGYDAVFFSGISQKPVYLWINDGKVELKDASHLWGMDAKETWTALQKETGQSKVRVSCIGPSGERLSYVSCPINDGHRAAGRGGGGAVMGSKKLKAVAVYGTKEVPVADPAKVLEVNKKLSEIIKTSEMAAAFGGFGTGVGTGASALSGDSPVKNWAGAGVVDFGEESANKVASIGIDAKYKTKKYHCSACPLGCGAEYEVKEGDWPLPQSERPEYETLCAFGTLMLNDNAESILKCNEICNVYGLDTISAGATVAWAMDCYNNGVLTKKDLDGIDLSWGNAEGIVAITQKLAECEGCGAVLSKGSAYAAKKWGKGAEYLVTASGIELPMHDPRFAPGMTRTYRYDPTPGRHVKGGLGSAQMSGVTAFGDKYDYRATGYWDVLMAAGTEIMNCGGYCMFITIVAPPGIQEEFLSAVTGIPFTAQHAQTTGLRILAMRQAFNVREGIKPSDLTLSARPQGHPPLTAGPLAAVDIDSDRLARNFFAFVGWDMETGKPKLEMLKKLGHMDEVIRDMYGNAAK